MLLSKPQKLLLECLRNYGAVRENQTPALLGQSEHQAGLLIQQLICGGLVRRENGCLLLSDDRINEKTEDILEAITVMLQLAPEGVELHQKGTPPFTLTFFKPRQDKLWRYDICPAPPGKEIVINAMLEGVNHKYRMIVLLLHTLEQQTLLSVPCEHCFAHKENGIYRFYK